MNRRDFLRSTVAVSTGLTILPSGTLSGVDASVHASAEKPNIIYIMADELSYFDPGFMGNQEIQTPNLDQMAADGMIFRNMLAGGPNCAPTRCCLLTGKHAGHTSVRDNGGATPLRAEEETIGSALKRQGYATGGFGKWGIGARGSTGVPEKHGFDVFFGYYDQVHAHTYYPPYLIRNSEEVPLEGNYGLSKPGKTYAQYVIHDAAMKWIREHAQGPFFAYLPYTPPHGIFAIPDNDPALAVYKDKPWAKDKRLYAAMTTMLDRQVGDIRALLKELGIEKNTLIMFSGDNGGAGHGNKNTNPRTGLVQYRAGKGSIYEGAFRVPFIACWPGEIPSGRISDHLGYFPDVLPTLAELAGAELPGGVDGVSFVPELTGETAAGRRQPQHDYLYWEQNDSRAIRQGNWRAVKPPKGAQWELYDLASDTSESKDLAAKYPEILARLTALVEQAHTPCQTGTFTTTEFLERDRRAKFGKHDQTTTEKKPRARKKAD
jgi:arylsulfatase A-like enzyme